MPTCEACGGDGECRNDFHNGSISSSMQSIISDCEDCGSSNSQMPGDCPDCEGSGYVEAFHSYVASWM